MRITILTVGTQGDVQPYIALGLGLQRAGHKVRLATLEYFQKFVSSQGLDFASLGGISQEFSPRCKDEERCNTISFNGFLGRVIWRRLLSSGLERLMTNCWDACQGAEAIVYSQLALPGYHIAEKLGVPCYAAYTHPRTPTHAFPNPFYTSVFPGDGRLNWLTHVYEEQVSWQFTRKAINRWRQETLNLSPIPFRGLHRQEHKQKIPILYCYSNAVVPKPSDWPEWAQVTGYWFLDRSPDWQPPVELVDFLEAGTPPVYIGFGSRTDYNPKAMTELVLAALAQTQQRGLLLTGQGEQSHTDVPDEVFKISSIPFDWLFPRLAAVVHHGGAGTMAAALRAGVPSFITPFGADQPFWGQRMADLGVGPSPIPGKKLTAEGLAAAIRAMTTDEAMKARARALGEKIRGEDGVVRAVEAFHHYLPSH